MLFRHCKEFTAKQSGELQKGLVVSIFIRKNINLKTPNIKNNTQPLQPQQVFSYIKNKNLRFPIQSFLNT
jgi:hypothetical protein